MPDGGELFATDLWAAWDLRDADAPRWRSAFTEPIADGALSQLPGVLWTHTPGPPEGGDATAWERSLASHFWSGQGRMSTPPPIPARRPFPCFEGIVPRLGGGGLGPIPTPWIGLAGTRCGPLFDPRIAVRVGPAIFERQPGFDPPWLVPFEVPDTLWVAAAEPDGWLPEEQVRYAGLGPGLALTSLLAARGEEFVDLLAQNPCGPPQCAVLPSPLAARAAAPASPPVLVLSARRRTLWAFETDAAQTRVSALDLDARAWRELSPGGTTLGRVLAATYSPQDDVLYVFDEISGRGHRREARLVRVDVGERHALGEVLGRWPRATSHDRFALAVDPVGTLYLAGSHPLGSITVVVRLGRSHRERIVATGLSVLRGRLILEGLRAGEHGLTVVLDDPREGALPVGIEYDELRPSGAAIDRCL